MKVTYTKAEMLALWRRIRAVEPLRLDCVVGRTDGPDLDAELTREMRTWYLDLLDHGPLEHVAPEEAADQATVSTPTDSIVLVTAPEGTRRVLSVEFEGWPVPLAPQTEPALLARRASNPFLVRPDAAIIGPDKIAVIGVVGSLTSLVCVIDPGPDLYIFDDAALPFNLG